MAKRSKNNAPARHIPLSSKEKMRLERYRNKMIGAWLAMSIVWVATLALAASQASEILTRLKTLDAADQIGYVIIAVAFMFYRHGSRKQMISAPRFSQGIERSIDKARRFNNIELLKAVTSYALVCVPALHFSRLLDPLLIYFGLTPSSATSTAAQWLTSTIVFLASNALAGVIGGIAYDHFKRRQQAPASG